MLYALLYCSVVISLRRKEMTHVLGGIQEKIEFLNSSQNRFFSGVCAGAAISKKYPEVGAYNSPWIKSYEHRRVNFFFAAY